MKVEFAIRFPVIAAAIVGALWLAPAADAACIDDTGDCAAIPCPAADTCRADADCGEGFVCEPYDIGEPCWPSECYCEVTNVADWVCTDDCAGLCTPAPSESVPTASEWALIQLSLLLLAAGTLVFGGAMRVRPGATTGVLRLVGTLVRPAAFARLAGLALGLTLAGLGLATWTGLAPSAVDVRGSLVSAVLAAFVLHLWGRPGSDD